MNAFVVCKNYTSHPGSPSRPATDHIYPGTDHTYAIDAPTRCRHLTRRPPVTPHSYAIDAPTRRRERESTLTQPRRDPGMDPGPPQQAYRPRTPATGGASTPPRQSTAARVTPLRPSHIPPSLSQRCSRPLKTRGARLCNTLSMLGRRAGSPSQHASSNAPRWACSSRSWSSGRSPFEA